MGGYLPQNYTEIVKLGGVEIPCGCWVSVSGGGKILVIHNGIKEQTGWKDHKVIIKGRLEGENEDDLNSQIKKIAALGKKQEALNIISKETDYWNIKKIVLEDDPKILPITDFDLSRTLVIEGLEDQEVELGFDLAQKRDENIKAITDPKKKAKNEYYIVKKGDSLSKIAAKIKIYGDHTLWRIIYNANKKTIGTNPNLIRPGQKLLIPKLSSSSSEYTIKKSDTYASIAIAQYNNVTFKKKIMKANDYIDLVVGNTLVIPGLLDSDKEAFKNKW